MIRNESFVAELQSFTKDDRQKNLLVPEVKDGFRGLLKNTAADSAQRDAALWSLTNLGKKNTSGLLSEVAVDESNTKLRKSAAWALFKLGRCDILKDILALEKDENIQNWKRFLINETLDTSLPFDSRPAKYEPDQPYDFVMPLEVEGVVEFRDEKGNWHTLATGPISNERMIGDLTPAIKAPSFQDTLVLQKRIKNLNGSGEDHIEGYLLKGLSRQIGENVFRHQYEAISEHAIYPSGIVGDESKGKIEKAIATLARHADTHLSFKPDIPFPFPHSVRGAFRGFVFMNPVILDDPGRPLDGLLQILSPMEPEAGQLVNGIFYGTFRGIPEDIDNDGKVELNSIEILVDKHGKVCLQEK